MRVSMNDEMWWEMKWEMRKEMRWDKRWDERWVERCEMISEMRWEMRQEMRWEKSWDGRWDLKLDEGWLMAQVAISNDFTSTWGVFNGKCSFIMTNRWNNNMIWKKHLLYALSAQIWRKNTKIHTKTMKSSIFSCSRPKMDVFQIFQDRFFHGILISIQEGLAKTLILVPPLFASKNHVSVL